MSNSAIPLIISSSGVTAVFVAVFNSLFNRRKLKADTTAVLTTAAGGIVSILQTDNGRLRAENASIKTRAERKERAERERDANFRRQLSAHHKYDSMVAQKLREAGIQVDDPPQLEFPDYEYDTDDLIGSDGPSPE